MNNIEAYQLCHPELLSEDTLRDILNNSRIILPACKNLIKEELIEIFRRIALPLPQRKYNDARTLGRALNNLRIKRGIKTATYNSENSELPSETSPINDQKNRRVGGKVCSGKDRLKPPISEKQELCKKIRLSNSCCMENLAETDTKRKSEGSPCSESKKRQKITWP